MEGTDGSSAGATGLESWDSENLAARVGGGGIGAGRAVAGEAVVGAEAVEALRVGEVGAFFTDYMSWSVRPF